MKGLFVFTLFALLISSTGFAAEQSQDSNKQYRISYLNQVYSVQVNPDDTTVADIPGIGVCNGSLDGGANVADFNYFDESSEGGNCEHANVRIIEYSNDTLGIVKSMRIGVSKTFLGYLEGSTKQIGIRISRIK